MATKWRSFSTSLATKVTAFILVVILISGSVSLLLYSKYAGSDIEPLFEKEFKNSETFFGNYVNPALLDAEEVIRTGEDPLKKDYYYYISDGKKTWSNTKNTDRQFFENYDRAFFAFENGQNAYGENTFVRPLYMSELDSKVVIYIAFPDKFMDEKQKLWTTSREKAIPAAILFATAVVVVLFLIGLLINGTGRKADDHKLYFSGLDRIYTDVVLFGSGVIAIWWLNIISSELGISNTQGSITMNEFASISLFALLNAGVATIAGLILLSFIRKIKGDMLLKHSLAYVICFSIYDLIKSLFDGRRFANYPFTKSLFYRQVLFIASSFILVVFTFMFWQSAPSLALFPPLVEIAIVYWFVKGNNETFEAINKGINESLEDQMKAERMKVMLVTNVSHDLKTPLTSIISYVDLLSKEEDLSPTARDYVKVLAAKSDRLKHIVSDLFDLAKSTSGNMSLEEETLDLKKLMQQTLADMENEISASELHLKTKFPAQAVPIYSDGKKLYRVFQNIVDNALKYAMKGTRVYVDLEELNGYAIATIKNTAGYEMNFTADEILQRFSRGDKSRATDGSGLGLSIAESFTTICGGHFKVDIDGDMFKVTVSLPIR